MAIFINNGRRPAIFPFGRIVISDPGANILRGLLLRIAMDSRRVRQLAPS
jgi:hypothetical protein